MAATQYVINRSLSIGSARLRAGDVVEASEIPKRSVAWLKRLGYITERSED